MQRSSTTPAKILSGVRFALDARVVVFLVFFFKVSSWQNCSCSLLLCCVKKRKFDDRRRRRSSPKTERATLRKLLRGVRKDGSIRVMCSGFFYCMPICSCSLSCL